MEDTVYKLQLTYDEIIDILHLKFIPSKRTGYCLYPSIFEISDLNKTLDHR